MGYFTWREVGEEFKNTMKSNLWHPIIMPVPAFGSSLVFFIFFFLVIRQIGRGNVGLRTSRAIPKYTSYF